MSVVEISKNKKIEEGYRPAIEKELKSRRREVYWDKQEIDMEVVAEVNHTLEDISNMTEQDKEAYRKKLLSDK